MGETKPSKDAESTDAAVPSAAMDEDADDSEDPETEEEAASATARCRFVDADSAKKALDNLRELDEAKVEVVLLTGAEEEKFWAETNAKLKDLFDNPRTFKGKGKDKGKGKGKGKAKGKG